MILGSLTPFADAIAGLARRRALPTNLGSAELRQLGAAFHRENLVSARNNLAGVMDDFKAILEKIVNPVTDTTDPAAPRTAGLDAASARLQIKQLLKSRGYTAAPGEEGTIKDLASDRRVNLFLKTNVELSFGRGSFIQSQDPAVIEAYPAQELVRFQTRTAERDWTGRWRAAASISGDTDAARILAETGRMIARKDSPVWQALGDGAGGFEDTLGNPYPPFAFSSGMWVQDVEFELAEQLGLVNPGNIPEPQKLDFESLFSST